jgi:hypothetical protein
MPSFDSSALSALLEEDEPAANDGELILPIEFQYAAAVVGVEPQASQQVQFDQMVAAEHPALQTQMSSTASELMQLASSGYGDDCFAAAMGGVGGYVGLDEALVCQPPPGASLLTAEAAMQGGRFFGNEAARGGFLGAGMVMPMMGMDETGEYRRMMECSGASALGVATHNPDADSVAATMPFCGGNAGEMQVEFMHGRNTERHEPHTYVHRASSMTRVVWWCVPDEREHEPGAAAGDVERGGPQLQERPHQRRGEAGEDPQVHQEAERAQLQQEDQGTVILGPGLWRHGSLFTDGVVLSLVLAPKNGTTLFFYDDSIH